MSDDITATPAQMVVLFVLFVGELLLVTVVLAGEGVVSTIAAVVVVAVMLGVFAAWGAYFWYQNRSTDDESVQPQQANPVETLKQRYAAGELSEEEFERKLETLLDAEQTAERPVDGLLTVEADDQQSVDSSSPEPERPQSD